MMRSAFLLALGLPGSLAAQSAPGPAPEAQRCAALATFDLEEAPGGPALITSARMVAVPPTGLERWILTPSGFGSAADNTGGRIKTYCDVTGYVAPQNKFELKLPPPKDWNQNFFFYACGAFCGTVFGDAPNLGLARGYASATGNGGHDSAWGFDGVWAANAPELQEDFGWRSNHVVTLAAKIITTRYYGKPIKYSYMAGGSKGGQAVLLEAQRFPQDFDGLLASAPVYDYTGRKPTRPPGLRRRSAMVAAARCSTPPPPKWFINPCWSTAALKTAWRKESLSIRHRANGSRKWLRARPGETAPTASLENRWRP